MSDESNLKPPEIASVVDEAAQAAGGGDTTEPVKADTVNLEGGVQYVEARLVNIRNGGIGALKGEAVTVTVEDGGIGAMAARRADVTMNGSSGIGAMAAQEVSLTNSTVSVLAALRVTGNPKIFFDLRAGLLAGFVAGVVFGTMAVAARLATRGARS